MNGGIQIHGKTVLNNTDINNPDIDGGTADDLEIGTSVPAPGSFTTLRVSTDPVDSRYVGNRGFNDLRYVPKNLDATTSMDPDENEAVSREIVDKFGGVVISLTRRGNPQILQRPSDPTFIKRFIVVTDDENRDHTIEVNGITMSAAEAQWFIWDGTAWIAIAAMDADDVAFTPTGGIIATTVQSAIAEVNTKKLEKADNLSDVFDAALSFGNIKQPASETDTGVIEKATTAEAVTGTDTNRAITPAGLSARMEEPGEIGGITPAPGNFTDLKAENDDIRIRNNFLENGVVHISKPVGGSNYIGSGSGALKITLPQSWTSTMLSFHCDIYDHLPDKSFSLNISGYNRLSGTEWDSTSVQFIGDKAHSKRVRFGHDGTHCCLFIGDTADDGGATSWHYPEVSVNNFRSHFTTISIDAWNDGWDISLVNTTDGVTFTKDHSATNLGYLTDLDEDLTPQLSADLGGQGHYLIDTQNIQDLQSDGAAYYFDGSNNMVKITDMDNFSGHVGTIVVSFAHDVEAFQILVGVGDETASLVNLFNFRLNSSNQLEIQQKVDGVENRLQCSSVIPMGTESVAVLVSDGSEYSIYLNGNLETISVITGSNDGKWFGDIPGIDNFTVGVSEITTAAQYYSGNISKVLVFNRIISKTEVKALSSGVSVPFKDVGGSETELFSDSTAKDLNTSWQTWQAPDTIIDAYKSVRISYEVTVNTSDASGIQLFRDTYVPGGIVNNDHYGLPVSVGVHHYDTLADGTYGPIPRRSVDLGATGLTAGTLTVANIVVTQLGCVLNLDSPGVSDTQWKDVSGNDLHGNVDGAIAINIPIGNFSDDVNLNGNYLVGTQNIADLAAKGTGYWFDGVNDYIHLNDNQFPSGSQDRTIIASFNPMERTISNSLLAYGTYSINNFFGLSILTNNTISVSGHTNNYSGSLTVNNNKENIVCAILNSGNLTTYLNSIIDINNISTTLNTILSGNAYIGARDAGLHGVFNNNINNILMFNLALTETEMKAFSSGAPVPYKYLGASQTELIPQGIGSRNLDFSVDVANTTEFTAAYDWIVNGTPIITISGNVFTMVASGGGSGIRLDNILTIGKSHTLVLNVTAKTGTNFNIECPYGTVLGTITQTGIYTLNFVPKSNTGLRIYSAGGGTGTIEITAGVINNSVVQIGCVLQLEQPGVGHNQWLDTSGNELHGAVSGPIPTNLEANHQEKIIKKSVTGDSLWTDIIPAGYILERLICEETAGNAAILDMGTSDGANDVFTGITIAASDITVIEINKMFSSSAAQTLDINDDQTGSSWNSASINITLICGRIQL